MAQLVETGCATSQEVAGSIPGGVLEFFIDIILPAAIWPCGSKQPRTEIRVPRIFPGG